MEILIVLIFIFFIIGLPMLLFFRWLFGTRLKHHFNSDATRTSSAWIAAILSVPVICILLVVLIIKASTYYPDRKFTRKEWMVNPDERYTLTKKLISSKMLIGKTREEVLRILGEGAQNYESDSTTLYYSIGFIPAFMDTHNFSPSLLYVKLNEGRVTEVSQDHE